MDFSDDCTGDLKDRTGEAKLQDDIPVALFSSAARQSAVKSSNSPRSSQN